MIEIIKDRTFHIATRNTSYIFSILPTGHAEHIYYGKRLKNIQASILAIREKHLVAPVFSVYADRKSPNYSLNDTLLEFSTEGKGDFRIPFLSISYGEDGIRTGNFIYSGYDVYKGIKRFTTLTQPQAVATDSEADTLEVQFKDKDSGLMLMLLYTSFNDSDVITRRSIIVNQSKEAVTIRSIASSQIDIRADKVELTTFQGDWARERFIKTHEISDGTYMVESRSLESSSEANPAFIVRRDKDTYLFNLVYSGAHRASVSITSHSIAHIVWGINPDMFSWKLESDEIFESPEAVLIYSDKGIDGVRDISHRFVNSNIRRGNWRDRMKPLMFNTWEGFYFDIDENKLSAIVKNAKEMGMEGIVIDDGWFGARNDDTSSLGDWYCDTMKFPSGLSESASEIHRNGMLFGIWLEPEAVSEKSELAKKHPDWIIGKNVRENAEGRHQQLLDLANPDVQEWIIGTIERIVDLTHADYIKWDMNRRYSDIFSHKGNMRDYGSYFHKYITGLYTILRTLTLHFPNLYIEGCASGGARFDLGILSYCPSIWTSDCSDPVERLAITEGTSIAYPTSVMGVSVSCSPNAHTRREIDLDTRFESALFGVLSYSVNGTNIDRKTMDAYKKECEFYKCYRSLLQFGIFRVQESGNRRVWTISTPDSSLILVFYFQKEVRINTSAEKLYIDCANEDFDYRFYPRERQLAESTGSIVYNEEPESYIVSGSALKWAGISLSEQFSGNGYEDGMRVLGDFKSRLYILRRIE